MRPLVVLSLAVACDSQPDGDCVHSFYEDRDGDRHGAADATRSGCIAPPGYETTHDDCDDGNSDVHPGAVELCNGDDDDCDGKADSGETWYADWDGDGWGNDDESSCVESPLWSTTDSGDCNDEEATVNPGAQEICNGIDDDCNGTEDDAADMPLWYVDGDGDGHGAGDVFFWACNEPEGATSEPTDCDDHDAAVSPDAQETCNERDDDCDGLTDDSDPSVTGRAQFYVDADGDGVGAALSGSVIQCFAPTGYAETHGDCDDSDADVVLPTTLYRDSDRDGYGSGADERCAGPSSGSEWIPTDGDCDDTRSEVFPGAAEVCNVVDDNCDGLVDEDDPLFVGPTFYADVDKDGYGDPSASVSRCAPPPGYLARDGDCDDTRYDVFPGAADVCNDVDDNCDGLVDEDDPLVVWTTFYADGDDDGYGDNSMTVSSCDPPSRYVARDGDCDDTVATTHLDAEEICVNGADDDCDQVIDPCAVDLDAADWSLEGPLAPSASTLGFTVLAADLNGDGAADLIAGAPEIDPPVYVFFGPPSSDTSTLDDANLTFESIGASSGLGDALGAADANGDGMMDVLLGAPDDHIAYLFLGPVTSAGDVETADAAFLAPDRGPSATVARIVPDFDGDLRAEPEVVVNAIDLSSAHEGTVYLAPATTTETLSLPRNATYIYTGGSYYELGASIVPIGDTTGDGVDDLAIGATGPSAYAVFFLAGDGPPGAYTIGDAAFGQLGSPRADGFGHSMAATDYDGDGHVDIFIGAPDEGPSVYGFMGPFLGYESYTPGDERDAEDAEIRWIGKDALGFSVAAGGDVDGDGAPDVLLGAYDRARQRGSAYLSLRGLEGVVDVEDLLSFESPTDGNVAGYAVEFVGDWSGDGNAEVAFGQPFLSHAGDAESGAGRVDVVFSENLY